MQLKVRDRIIDKYNNIAVSLRYDSVASPFGANIYFNPSNADDRRLFVPGNYNPVTIVHGKETLITGVLLSAGFQDSAVKHLMNIGGYSKAGVLDDCQNSVDNYPLQFNNVSLFEIAQKLCSPFGLNVVVDDIVKNECSAAYAVGQTMEPDDTIKNFLTKLAVQKNIVLSHDIAGNLLFTRADTTKQPIFNFVNGMPWVGMSLNFDGQQMHSVIWGIGQGNIDTANASEASIKNPYVQSHLNFMETARLNTILKPGVSYDTGYRPRVSMQTSGGDNDTTLTARQLLSQELKTIRLSIEIQGWELKGKLVRPNNIITVTNPDLFLYQKTRWFIESVDFRGDERSETATLNCVLPECYNNETVKNVFTGTNLTVPVPFVETGAHATITPFDQPNPIG